MLFEDLAGWDGDGWEGGSGEKGHIYTYICIYTYIQSNYPLIKNFFKRTK